MSVELRPCPLCGGQPTAPSEGADGSCRGDAKATLALMLDMVADQQLEIIALKAQIAKLQAVTPAPHPEDEQGDAA